MHTAIREVRRAKGMTLEEVARRCRPPTTPQTIGRLETGARTVSVDWLDRIAGALGVAAADLVKWPGHCALPVSAILDGSGVHPPKHAQIVTAPDAAPGQLAVIVAVSVGEYRAGDELWCERLERDAFGQALNHDVLVPRSRDRFLFGRLIGHDGDKLQLVPPSAGIRQQVIVDPPWIARAVRMVRTL